MQEETLTKEQLKQLFREAREYQRIYGVECCKGCKTKHTSVWAGAFHLIWLCFIGRTE